MDALQRRDLEAFARRLILPQGLSPRSVARTVACTRGSYRFLLLEKQIGTDPARIYSRHRAHGPRSPSISTSTMWIGC